MVIGGHFGNSALCILIHLFFLFQQPHVRFSHSSPKHMLVKAQEADVWLFPLCRHCRHPHPQCSNSFGLVLVERPTGSGGAALKIKEASSLVRKLFIIPGYPGCIVLEMPLSLYITMEVCQRSEAGKGDWLRANPRRHEGNYIMSTVGV